MITLLFCLQYYVQRHMFVCVWDNSNSNSNSNSNRQSSNSISNNNIQSHGNSNNNWVVCSLIVGPVEVLFSIGGRFVWCKCRITNSVFERLVNIKCNGHLV